MMPAIGTTKELPKLLVCENFTQVPEPRPQMGLGCSQPPRDDSRLITSHTHIPASQPGSAIIPCIKPIRGFQEARESPQRQEGAYRPTRNPRRGFEVNRPASCGGTVPRDRRSASQATDP